MSGNHGRSHTGVFIIDNKIRWQLGLWCLCWGPPTRRGSIAFLYDSEHLSTTKLEHTTLLLLLVAAAVVASPLRVIPIAAPALVRALDYRFVATDRALAILRAAVTPGPLCAAVATILVDAWEVAESVVETDVVVWAAHWRTVAARVDI